MSACCGGIFIVGFPISLIGPLFVVEMRLFVGGGIGCERILLFVFAGGSGLTWCPLLYFSSVSLTSHTVVLGCLLIQLGIDGEFRKAWLPHFLSLSLPELTGEMLAQVVRRKGATAGSLDGWGWRELQALPVSWFDGLARILSNVEETSVWLEGLLDACIAMIPKTDGDATPLRVSPEYNVHCCFVLALLQVFGCSSVVC